MRQPKWWIVSLLVAQLGQVSHGNAKTINQVAFSNRQVTVGKVTRSFTVSNPNVQRELFGSVGGGSSFTYYDGSTPVQVVVGLDPAWNRLVYSTDLDGDPIRGVGEYGSDQRQFSHPRGIDVSPYGHTYVADTGNNRIQMFAFQPDAVGLYPPRSLVLQFIVDGGSNFSQPTKVLWDDNATPSVSTDDIVWILDTGSARVAAYHVTNDGNGFVASPYVFLALDQLAPGTHRRAPVCFTKGRSYTSPDELGSYCTPDLYLYDAYNDQFLILSVPRSPGLINNPASVVTVQVLPNPTPGAWFTHLAADAWGNILGLDLSGSQIVKMDPSLNVLATYGSYGTGGLGSEQMLEPVSLAPRRIRNPDHTTSNTSTVHLFEKWSDNSGLQALTLGLEVKNLAVDPLGPSGVVTASYLTTDNCRVRVRVLNQVGQVTRTISDGSVVTAGSHSFVWDGNTDAGSQAPRCLAYAVEVRGIGLYANPETSTVAASFYYKPSGTRTMQISSNVPGTRFTVDGRDTTLAGTSASYPCSLCTTHAVSVPPTQVIAGTRYCFGSWSNGGNRPQSISTLSDSTLSLSLITYAGPTTIPVGGFLYDDAYDCRSPYMFQGNGSFGTTVVLDTFRTWGNVVFRMPRNGGSLQIPGPFKATNATFETIDSTAGGGANRWAGILVNHNGSVFLDGCKIRNAVTGLSNVGTCFGFRNLDVRNCLFEFNAASINVWTDSIGSPTVTLTNNRFNEPLAVQLTVPSRRTTPTATAIIRDNYFLSSPTTGLGAINLTGPWGGEVTRDTFTVSVANSKGIVLNQGPTSCSGSPLLGSPSVTINGNKFYAVGGNQRFALQTAFGPVQTINAASNDWGVYDVTSISTLIKDSHDDVGRAEAIFQPFSQPSGGSGGGTGGCPFILSRCESTLTLENSILGLSELTADGYVSDACPLQFASPSRDGKIRLTVAEFENETDRLDYLAVGLVDLQDGEEIGSDASGAVSVFRRSNTSLTRSGWTGRGGPTGAADAPWKYEGTRGDSLDFDVASMVTEGSKRGLGISLAHKQPSAALPGIPSVGITVRVSPDANGTRWITLGTIPPRENLSTVILGLAALEGLAPRRIRLVWQAEHTVAWVGLTESRKVTPKLLPLLSARHSSEGYIEQKVKSRDGTAVVLNPGEAVDLEFDGSSVSPEAKMVFLSYGRYSHPGSDKTSVLPKAFYLGRTRPNPFNPETAVELDLPTDATVSARIFNVEGRLVRTLVTQKMTAGVQLLRWDGRDDRGRSVASGVYYLDVRAGTFRARQSLVVLR